MVHGRNESACYPLELASLYFGSLTRETRMLLYYVAASAERTQATPLVRRQNLISKKPFQSATKAVQQQITAQPMVFWTALVKPRFRSWGIVLVLLLDLPGFCQQKEGMILLRLFCSVGMTSGYKEFSNTSC